MISTDHLPHHGSLVLHVMFQANPHMKTLSKRVDSVLKKYAKNGLLKTEFGSSHIGSLLLNGKLVPNQGYIVFTYTLKDNNGMEKQCRTHLKRMLNALLKIQELACVKNLYIYKREYVGVS